MKINWNRTLFETQIKKIKWTSLREYCLTFFKIKDLTIRISGYGLITLISALLFFILRANALDDPTASIQFNIGFAWGLGGNWDQSLVYFLKILPTVIFFILSLCLLQWYAYLSVFLIGINSLFNIIDKALVDVYFGTKYYDSVVDYFYWSAFGFTNNIADIFIILGSGLAIISVLYMVYEEYKNSKKRVVAEDDHSPSNPSQKQ